MDTQRNKQALTGKILKQKNLRKSPKNGGKPNTESQAKPTLIQCRSHWRKTTRQAGFTLVLLSCFSFGGIIASPTDKDFGEAQLPDSGKYQGQFKNGLFNGKGKIVWRDGSVYEGEFKNGLFEGKGVFHYKNGELYAGQFKDGLAQGKGEHTYSNGDRYQGDFSDGLPEGIGTYSGDNGYKYRGEFKHGYFHGKGKSNLANGDHYDGEFFKGYEQGFGTYYYSNGDHYQGEFRAGVFHGRGKFFTQETGEVIQGEWRNGQIMQPKDTPKGSFFQET
jgi:hypothetical protein